MKNLKHNMSIAFIYAFVITCAATVVIAASYWLSAFNGGMQ